MRYLYCCISNDSFKIKISGANMSALLKPKKFVNLWNLILQNFSVYKLINSAWFLI